MMNIFQSIVMANINITSAQTILFPFNAKRTVDLCSSGWSGFSRGWKESFMSGDNEPWIFRGGLTGDLEVSWQRSPVFLFNKYNIHASNLWFMDDS